MERLRVDKWLWAARFFKTRALAQKAVNGGKVHVNGTRIKPAHEVTPGDRLKITKGSTHFEVVVEAISDCRGPARVAEQLYAETEESIERRKREAEIRRMDRLARPVPDRRPDRKDRRRLRKLAGKE